MFGPRRPQNPNMCWDYHRPPHYPQWRHPGGPRAPFRGQHQRFNQHRLPFQSGNDNYWCETCCKGFPTEDMLSKHNQQHQKCNIDGCQFVAHPKVITQHIQMQHSTGLYKKICNLQNPEEIAKWREERRKKYPTKSNIDKKAAELKEKIDRGEKMGLKSNHNKIHNSTQNRHNSSGQTVKRRNAMQNDNQLRSKFMRNNTDNNYKKPVVQKATSIKFPIVEDNRKLKPFAGILNLQMESDNELKNEDDFTEANDLIEDDDYGAESKRTEIKSMDTTEPPVCGALSSLICDYGSSEEEDNKAIVSIKYTNQEPSEDTQDCKMTKASVLLQKLNQVTKTTTHKSSNGVKCKAVIKKRLVDLEDTVHTLNVDKNDNGNMKYKNEINKELVNLEDTVHTQQVNIDGNRLTKFKNKANKDHMDSVSNEDDNDSGPEELKAVVKKEDTSTSAESSKARVFMNKKKEKEKKLVFQRPQPKLPSTLLHKLLYKEMQQERNIVLQCIRYIKRNNYFELKE